MQLEEEGRRDSAGLPREEMRHARADSVGDGYLFAAGIALAAHGPVDRTRTSLPLTDRVQWRSPVQGSPAGLCRGRLVAWESAGASEEGAGKELSLGQVVVDLRLLLWRVLAEGGEPALHQPPVGGSVFVD